MIVSSSMVSSAKSFGRKRLAASTTVGERLTNVDDVVDLLVSSTSPAAHPGARRLLKQMAAESWCVVRGAHRSRDGNTHVTIDIRGTRYHLRLDRRDCVYDISRYVDNQAQRPAGRDPWVRPGA